MTKNSEKIDFAQICRHLRAVTGFTQQQMADFLGISVRAYQRYEAGTGRPHADSAFRIAEMHIAFQRTFMSPFILKQVKYP